MLARFVRSFKFILNSSARCFFSLIADLARSYMDILGLDGVMDLGVSGRETGGSIDDEGVERISGGGIEGMDGGVEGSVGGIKGGGCEIRTAGSVGGIKEGGDEGIGEGGDEGIVAMGGGVEGRVGEEHFEAVVSGVVPRDSSL